MANKISPQTKPQLEPQTLQLLLRQDKLNNPTMYKEIHKALRLIMAEWVRARVRPTKNIGYDWDLQVINWYFKHQTGLYSLTGMMFGALLEAGYRVEMKAGRPCFNCSVAKFRFSNKYHSYPEFYKYLHTRQPIYSEWVSEATGNWLPELYTDLPRLKQQYYPERYDGKS